MEMMQMTNVKTIVEIQDICAKDLKQRIFRELDGAE